ncbi:MAG TPA: phytanoyl-CoA dioxygenase family protein [Chloroflexota bacterium]|nr:phytanoyl-CoA dioxygenase family protein [Chloroflexota bacterium]
MATASASAGLDSAALVDAIYRDGFVGIPDLFPVEWADRLDEDLKRELVAALSHEGGAAPRGWNRFYFEPYPERVRGFLELVTHPVITELSVRLFGEEYQIVELGCDVPLPGAVNQPWHRDFPIPDETRQGRISSVCLNVCSVDVTPEMGPFQVVPGTHFDPGEDFDSGMFPPESRYAEYESRMQSRFPRRGSVSVRSGLGIHRGSRSSTRGCLRPVAIVGIVSPECGAVTERRAHPEDPHVPRLRVSREFLDGLDAEIRRHLSYEIVADTTVGLPPHFTHHTFEGLKMAEMG